MVKGLGSITGATFYNRGQTCSDILFAITFGTGTDQRKLWPTPTYGQLVIQFTDGTATFREDG